MRIYVITHAHTQQAPNVAVDEWTLSLRGIEQARRLVDAPFWSEVRHVVVSSEPKCWLRVEAIVRARNLPVWIDCRFDELRRGGWTENYSDQVAAVFVEPTRSIAGWERADDAKVRCLAGLAGLQRRFGSETVALVGHGLSISLLRASLLGHSQVDFDAWQRLSFASYAYFSGEPLALERDFVLSAERTR